MNFKRIYATSVVRHPVFWTAAILFVIGAWATGLSQLVINPSTERMFLNNDPSRVFYEHFRESFGTNDTSIVSVHREQGWFRQDAVAQLEDIEESLWALPHVVQVIGPRQATVLEHVDGAVVAQSLFPEAGAEFDPEQSRRIAALDPWVGQQFVSQDEQDVAFVVSLEAASKNGKPGQEFTEQFYQWRDQLEQQTDLNVTAAGGALFVDALSQSIRTDLRLFIPLCVVLLSLLLFITFRTAMGVALPMLVVNLGVAATLGFMGVAQFPIATVTVILPPLLLVIGITNVIHIINAVHEKDEQRQASDRQSVIEALAEVIGPCTLSSLTTAIGFASLALNDVDTVQETGLIACFGIIMTYATAVVLTPAALALMPRSWIVSTRVEWRSGGVQKYLNAVYHQVCTRPRTIVFLTLVAATVVAVGVARIEVETNLRKYFAEDAPFRVAAAYLEETFGASIPYEILVQGSPETLLSPQNIEFMGQLEQYLAEKDNYGSTMGPAGLIARVFRAQNGTQLQLGQSADSHADNRQLLFWYEIGGSDIVNQLIDFERGRMRIALRGLNMSSAESQELFEDIDQFVEAHAPDGLEVGFADGNARFVHLVDTIVPAQVRSLALAMFVIWLVLIVAMRSLSMATLAMLPNAIPILMVLGIMGWTGIQLTFATAMIPSIAIGLAVDDTIHVFSKFLALWRATADASLSIKRTLFESGRAVLFTSLVLFCGFIVLVASDFRPNMYFGILTAVTTIVAIIADLYLAPACLYWLYNDRSKSQTS